jgi:trehalose synthase
LEDYESYIGPEAVERIHAKAKKVQDLHVVNVSSTYYGGGVATLLSSLTILLNSVGLETGWRVIQGAPDFFSITKKMHNAHHSPWVWRCHVDMSSPDPELWEYLKPTIERYDAVVFSCNEYRQKLDTPQVIFMPAIDPFSITNRDLNEARINERLEHYDIPTDLSLVTQISRFDKWKDPEGVIRAFKQARKEVDATLVLLGNIATDDPEGQKVYHSILDERDERIIIMSVEDTALVNAVQRKAAVVLQKSKREGFGLTVAEAMWKGNPVIGGDVGGIRYQIEDGENGYLVSSEEEAADGIVELLKNEDRRRRMGERARETVRDRFLLSRLLEQYLDLFASFETVFRLNM